MTTVEVDPYDPDPRAVATAAGVVRRGGIVALPTDTLYGLAVDPFSAAGVARLFGAKGRDARRALPLVAATVEQVEERLGSLPATARRLAAAFWPGPLTLLIPAPAGLADAVSAGTGRVGVRVPAHAVPRALCDACGSPLTATSANRSGEQATNDPQEVRRTLAGAVDLLLDAGLTAGGPPSTVVDAAGEAPRLVRAGAISWERICECIAE